MNGSKPYGRRKSLFRSQYNVRGKRNLATIERIVTSKYERGAAFNRQHPFVDVLLADITESGEVLDVSELTVGEPVIRPRARDGHCAPGEARPQTIFCADHGKRNATTPY
jgi:hypothetical protein